MADVVVLGYLFAFLLINVHCAGLPELDLDDDGSQIQGPAEQQLDDPISLKDSFVHQSRYKCYQCEPPDCDELPLQKCENALSCFKSSVRTGDGTLQQSRGCTVRADQHQFTCRTKRHAGLHNISCCVGDYCNSGVFPSLAAADATARPLAGGGWRLWGSVSACLVVLACVSACAVLLLRRTHRLRVSRAALHKLGADSNYFTSNMYSPSPYYEGGVIGAGLGSGLGEGSWGGGVSAVAAGDSTLRQFLETSASSGSGSGLPLMVQRTLAKQVQLLDCVGKGRYGEVWRGSWYADTVAVKIFFSRDEASWRRETEIYSTVMLRHENILGYIGSDMTSRGSCTQLWLITQYHPLGSLYEHLARAELSRAQMMALCLSAAAGLLHLHTEIHGTQGKPAIAHRDIKSKNILVKSDGSCCIADLGLARTSRPPAGSAGPPGPPAGPPGPAAQGTRRYMSPEMLDQSMNTECFESYLKCDVYAFGLVLWEVCRRVRTAGGSPPPEARAPYFELAAADPSLDEMRKIVCVDQARPTPNADPHPTMVGMAALMRECWHAQARVRLPALRIKKTLLRLARADPDIALNDDNEVSV